MPCTHPLTALRLRDNRVVIIPDDDVSAPDHFLSAKYHGVVDKRFYVPCGKCHDCRCNYARNWAVRMMHEADITLPRPSIFGTFTYDNDHVHRDENGDMTLVSDDWPQFMKRLRRDFGAGIRFFQAGEYGRACQVCEHPKSLCTCETYHDGLGRPHHHAAIFGVSYGDGEFYKANGDQVHFTSKKMSEHWPHGHCCFTKLTYQSAAYIAGYALKKIYGDIAAEHYRARKPEFITMSRRPGIGGKWLASYYGDIYPHDQFNLNGKTLHPPRYYDKLYGRMDAESMECIKLEREEFLDEHLIYTADSVTSRRLLETQKSMRINRNKILSEEI